MAGVCLQAGYPPRFGRLFFRPLDFLRPALTLVIVSNVGYVVFPKAEISSPQVIAGWQQPPRVIDRYYFVTDFLELLRVLVVGARTRRDDAEGCRFFFISSGGSSTLVLYS